LKNEPFFVLNGDLVTNVNLNKMAKYHFQKKGVGTILVHPTDHPNDSDLVKYDSMGLVKKISR